MDKDYTVKADAVRPLGAIDKCFYCGEGIGATHKQGCVMRTNKIKIRVCFDLEDDVPGHWDKELIEFHYNESSYCCDNLLELITEYISKNECCCDICTVEYKEVK